LAVLRFSQLRPARAEALGAELAAVPPRRVGSKASDRPLDCSRLLRPRRRRGCAHDDRTGASACDETRDLAVAGSRRAIAVDHARASARAKREAVRARDQTDVRRGLVTQVFDPEARPARKRLRSLAGGQVEIAADAAPVAEQRDRGCSRVGPNRVGAKISVLPANQRFLAVRIEFWHPTRTQTTSMDRCLLGQRPRERGASGPSSNGVELRSVGRLISAQSCRFC
jgi:hypothetical protein